ncbi:hypothetical protein Tco_0264227, partial [Tanacetum coccineum]
VYPSRILSRCSTIDRGTVCFPLGNYFKILMSDFSLFEYLLGRCGHCDTLSGYQYSTTDSNYSSVNWKLKHSVGGRWYRSNLSYSRSSDDAIVR